jgi:hypothetical protein
MRVSPEPTGQVPVKTAFPWPGINRISLPIPNLRPVTCHDLGPLDFENKVLGKPGSVAAYLLIQAFGCDAIDRRQVGVQQDSLPTNKQNPGGSIGWGCCALTDHVPAVCCRTSQWSSSVSGLFVEIVLWKGESLDFAGRAPARF